MSDDEEIEVVPGSVVRLNKKKNYRGEFWEDPSEGLPYKPKDLQLFPPTPKEEFRLSPSPKKKWVQDFEFEEDPSSQLIHLLKKNDKEMDKFIKCTYCRKPPFGKGGRCERCSAIYCNEDCQRKDWPKHQQICSTNSKW